MIIFVFSCKQDVFEYENVDLKVYNTIKLDDKFNYGRICLVDSERVVLDVIKEKFFFISLNKKQKASYKKLLNKGKGSDEFLFLVWINNPYGNFLFYDLYMKKIFELKNNDRVNEISKIKCKEEYPLNINMIENKTFLATGVFHGGRFGIFDDNGNLLKEIGYYPIIDSLTIDNYFIASVFQSKIFSKPDNPEIVACITSSTELLELFRYDKKRKEMIRLNKIDISKTAKYKTIDNNMKYVSSSENIMGYISCSVTNSMIYVLFNKNIAEDVIKNINNVFCNEVRVFDWKGNLVRKYFLEKSVQSIYVYNDMLYSLGVDEDFYFQIYIYNLN